MIKGNKSNEGVDGGQRKSFGATETEDSSCFAVRREAKRFEHIPMRKITLGLVDATPEALQNLGNDDARESKKGPASAILRRSSVPARLGEELKKSTQTRYRPESTAISPSRLVVSFPDTTAVVTKNAFAILQADKQLQSSIHDFALRFQSKSFRALRDQAFVNVDGRSQKDLCGEDFYVHAN